MSGGTWDYVQYRFQDIVDSIKKEVERSGKPLTEKEMKEHFSYPDWFEKYPEDKFHYEYPKEVIEEFKKGIEIISKAQVYAQRIDWLISGDDGDETFLERLKDDLDELKRKKL